MKWSSPQRKPDGHHVHGPGDSEPMWFTPAEGHSHHTSGDPDHRVLAENHDASHISLRTVDSALRLLKSHGYIR